MARQAVRPRWVLAILSVAWWVYFAGFHPWFMNWGATPAEQRMALPGDQLLPNAPYRLTAITVRASASSVWPWIVQIGQDRAGFYSNTWLENLTGANIHNADSIHPEWQHRAIGDWVRLARPDLAGGVFLKVSQTRIVALEPDRLIANIPGRFVLQPMDGQTTRLLLREAVPSTFAGRAASALMWDPLHFVMEQRMLRGIKERAEGRPLVPSGLMLAARLGWILAGGGVLRLFLARGRRRLWALLPLMLALLVVRSTGDWNAALAGFLTAGITILGALEFGRRWWPPYLLLATAFGVAFDVVGLGVVAGHLLRAGTRDGTSKPIAHGG